MQYFEPNKIGRDFVVGDIHGCFSKLMDNLLAMNFDFDNDRLFCTGDLVDRGPESHLALEWLAYPWFHSVCGNHEDMAIGYAEVNPHTPGASSPWLYAQNGGQWFLDMPHTKQKLFANTFKQLPFRIQVGEYGIVHAEAPEDWLRPDPEHIMLWSRTRATLKDRKGTANIKKVFLGHTPMKKPLECGNNHYIDTGACFGYNFTIIELEHNEL